MTFSTELRAAMAAIQKVFPKVHVRHLAEGGGKAEILVGNAHDLALVLPNHGTPPGLIHCGDLRLRLSALPHGSTAKSSGVLSGQVAVVSGAASGLGLAIARSFHAAGACVVFTDVNVDGLVKATAACDDQSRVLSAVVDVTSETSVAAGFDAALMRFGRVDIVACCAGVAPAFALQDFPLAQWELALRINLTGYFLFGREAARIMQAQGHGGAMILLSSKSGLEPSKANSAYNATKAGEIHLARGWALELGRDQIRVNCIAPGNVFEGSQIWNADYIATVAKKRGIAPEQVIPHYIGLTALNRDIKPDDIANAAIFLCSDAARCVTGQVLVVDSGQVWSR
jgi:NAD(P)-dependent dehydrogenase (short-subunit alcohol dehydrogenase family)